jgi:hypothetical protein
MRCDEEGGKCRKEKKKQVREWFISVNEWKLIINFKELLVPTFAIMGIIHKRKIIATNKSPELLKLICHKCAVPIT